MRRSTVTLHQRSCPACGAPMPPIDADATQVTCAYCHGSFEVARRSSAARRSAETEPSSPGATPGAPSCLLFVIPVVAIGFGLAVAVAVVSSRDGRSGGEAVVASPDVYRGPSWLDQYAVPAVADVDGDGRLDLLAPFRQGSGGHDDEGEVFVGAFRGSDFEELWRIGPLQGDPTRQVGLLAVGERVVVQEPYGDVSVLDLRTGERLAQLPLPQNQSWAKLCPIEPDGPQVVIDNQAILDVQTLEFVKTGERLMRQLPAHCTRRRLPTNTTEMGSSFGEERGSRRAPAVVVEGHRTEGAWVDAGDGVAMLTPRRGEEAPIVFGFDAVTGDERWRAPVAALAEADNVEEVAAVDVGEGAAIVAYSGARGRSYRLIVLDARSGTRRFDLPLRASTWRGATFGDGRLWIAEYRGKNSGVRVVDLGSGDVRVFGPPDPE